MLDSSGYKPEKDERVHVDSDQDYNTCLVWSGCEDNVA